MQRVKYSLHFELIRKYIEHNGLGPKKVPLTKTLAADVFRQHYYAKKELEDFCRSVGISTVGLNCKDIHSLYSKRLPQ